MSPEAKNFVDKLLIKNPARRMTISQALVHPWMKKYCESIVQKRSQKNTQNETFHFYSAATMGDLGDN